MKQSASAISCVIDRKCGCHNQMGTGSQFAPRRDERVLKMKSIPRRVSTDDSVRVFWILPKYTFDQTGTPRHTTGTVVMIQRGS